MKICLLCHEKKFDKDFYRGHRICKLCKLKKLANRRPKLIGKELGETQKAEDVFDGSKGTMIWALCSHCECTSWRTESQVRKDKKTIIGRCPKCKAYGTKWLERENANPAYTKKWILPLPCEARLKDLIGDFLNSLSDKEYDEFIREHSENRQNETTNNRYCTR
jgi:hypothetical protein